MNGYSDPLSASPLTSQLQTFQRRNDIARQMGQQTAQQATNVQPASSFGGASRVLQAFLTNKMLTDASKQYAADQMTGPMMASQMPGIPV